MMAEAHLAGRLPRFEGRRIGFVVDGTVIGTFDRFTLSGSRLVLWGGPTDEQARRMADLLGAHLMPSGFKFTDACPARDPDR